MLFEQYHISGTNDRVCVSGDAQQSVKLNADGFFKALLSLPSRRCLDLLRIAAGVYAVDRISKRKKLRDNEDGIRQLRLVFEVRDHAFWTQSSINDALADVLCFLTDDDWSFDFQPAQLAPGDLGHQDFLDLPRPFQPRHAALYSGGLDSAAGLANRYLEGANDFILVTVSHQSGLHRRVEKQIKGLNTLIFNSRGIISNVLHSTLTTSLEGGKSKRIRQQERTQRTRAFFFCAAAAIAAKAYDLEVIEIFENGVGAINLPLMTGMLGSGLSTRGAHPTFLRLMSTLSGQVTEKPVRFVLPFDDKTKAEMLQDMKAVPDLATWSQSSRSCVHTSLRQVGKTHCGRCPGCIERRQAFAAANIEEDLDLYQTDLFVQPMNNEEEADYLHLFQLEAMKWVEGADNVQRRMRNHLRITDVSHEQDEKIIELQLRNAREVLRTLGDPFSRHETKLK